MEKKYYLDYSQQKFRHFPGRCSVQLNRVVALKDFGDVKAGDIGGWVSSEDNLSQEGDCWIFGEACVVDGARVSGDARIMEDAVVYDSAKVDGRAAVCGSAIVGRDAHVTADATVCDNAYVGGTAVVAGRAHICYHANVLGGLVSGKADVSGFGNVGGNARITGYAHITGNSTVRGNAKVRGYAVLGDKVYVDDDADIAGNVKCTGYTTFDVDAKIRTQRDFVHVENVPLGETTTVFKDANGTIVVRTSPSHALRKDVAYCGLLSQESDNVAWMPEWFMHALKKYFWEE